MLSHIHYALAMPRCLCLPTLVARCPAVCFHHSPTPNTTRRPSFRETLAMLSSQLPPPQQQDAQQQHSSSQTTSLTQVLNSLTKNNFEGSKRAWMWWQQNSATTHCLRCPKARQEWLFSHLQVQQMRFREVLCLSTLAAPDHFVSGTKHHKASFWRQTWPSRAVLSLMVQKAVQLSPS